MGGKFTGETEDWRKIARDDCIREVMDTRRKQGQAVPSSREAEEFVHRTADMADKKRKGEG